MKGGDGMKMLVDEKGRIAISDVRFWIKDAIKQYPEEHARLKGKEITWVKSVETLNMEVMTGWSLIGSWINGPV